MAKKRAATPSELQPAQRGRLFEELERQIRRHIRDSSLQRGDRLPTERELAHQLAVSRTSLRQAIVSLQVQGLVEVRHGDGIYVRDPDGPAEPISRLLERRRRLPEILEARETLECRLAALAAQRRTHEDIAAMGAALSQMEQDINDGGNGAEGDSAFHRAVTMAAKNNILAHLMAIISEPIVETRVASLSEPGRPRQSLESHRHIVETIERGDARGAAAAMRHHIRQVSDVALLRWKGV